jgi:hypothetical protein
MTDGDLDRAIAAHNERHKALWTAIRYLCYSTILLSIAAMANTAALIAIGHR